MRWFITTQTRIMLSSPTCSSRLLVGSSGNVAVLMQYSATWRIMARRAVCPLAFERTPSVSLSMLNFSFRWAHRDRQWRVHRCFIKFVGLGRLVKINNTQKDVFEWEYFTRRSWVCRSAYIQYCEKAERRSKLCRFWLEIPSAQKKCSHFWIITPTPWEFQKSYYSSRFYRLWHPAHGNLNMHRDEPKMEGAFTTMVCYCFQERNK